VRGGSWFTFEDYVRAANRHRFEPFSTYSSLGFRCALGTSP